MDLFKSGRIINGLILFFKINNCTLWGIETAKKEQPMEEAKEEFRLACQKALDSGVTPRDMIHLFAESSYESYIAILNYYELLPQ